MASKLAHMASKLTGEVGINFKSDSFPLDKYAALYFSPCTRLGLSQNSSPSPAFA